MTSPMPAWDVKKHGNDLYTAVPVSSLDLYEGYKGIVALSVVTKI